MIYDILPVNNYIGNNSNTVFYFDFYIENEEQLLVNYFDKDNNKKTLTLNVDYSINELKNKNGSYITFPIAGSNYGILNENEKISLELTLPISQEQQYNNSSLLNLETLEYSLDYLTRVVQILSRKVSRCVKTEECDNITPNEIINNIYKIQEEIKEQKRQIDNLAKDIEVNVDKNSGFISYINEHIKNFLAIPKLKKDVNELKEHTNDYKINRIDTDHSNDKLPYITERKANGSSWLQIWSDGRIEQGGQIANVRSMTVTFLKPFSNTNYTILGINASATSGNGVPSMVVNNLKKNNFTASVFEDNHTSTGTISWYACGY